MNRRLYRCRHNQRVTGVAAGVGEFFDLDPTLVRLVFFLSIFLGGLGLLLYIAMAIIVPLEPISADSADAASGSSAVPEGHRHSTRGDGRWVGRSATFVGLALILLGSLALVDRYLPALDAKHFLVPAIMIGIGALLIVSAMRREPQEPREPMET